MLHVYSNKIIESFVAESKEEAIELAREYFKEMNYDQEEWDLAFEQVQDDKIMTIVESIGIAHFACLNSVYQFLRNVIRNRTVTCTGSSTSSK